MGKAGLDRAVAEGQPLVEIVVRFRDGVDYREATDLFNQLADDIELHPGDWYSDPAFRVGTATKRALERLFGFGISRVNLERFDESTGTWDTWPDVYRWEVVTGAQQFPATLTDLIQDIGVSQPGADDDGQAREDVRQG
jgi:hypothetical protein